MKIEKSKLEEVKGYEAAVVIVDTDMLSETSEKHERDMIPNKYKNGSIAAFKLENSAFRYLICSKVRESRDDEAKEHMFTLACLSGVSEAVKHGCKTIAFAAPDAERFGLNESETAEIVTEVLAKLINTKEAKDIAIICRNDNDYKAYREVLEKYEVTESEKDDHDHSETHKMVQ